MSFGYITFLRLFSLVVLPHLYLFVKSLINNFNLTKNNWFHASLRPSELGRNTAEILFVAVVWSLHLQQCNWKASFIRRLMNGHFQFIMKDLRPKILNLKIKPMTSLWHQQVFFGGGVGGVIFNFMCKICLKFQGNSNKMNRILLVLKRSWRRDLILFIPWT